MSVELTNLDAERAVLGRILVDDRSWWDIADRLDVGCFSDSRHRAIFKAMGKLVDDGRPVARATLLSVIRDRDDAIDLAGCLERIKAEASKANELRSCVDAVLHTAGRRKILAALDSVKDSVEVAGLDVPVEALVQDACKQIEAADADAPDHSRSLIELISGVIDDLKDTLESGSKVGVRTGLRAYDDLIGSMLPGQLIVIGGETSSGKTALAMQVGVMIAQQGIPVHIAELEMTGKELARRVLARWSDIPASKLTDGEINRQQFDHAFRMGERADIPLYVDDTPQQSPSMLQARIARAIARRGVKVAIIDHLQYVKPPRETGKENVEIKWTVDDIKAMAKRLQIPIILVSHVSRSASDEYAVQTAADIRRPLLKDLYGSSAIEKAADAALFVHRPIWFLERATAGGKKADQLAADIKRWQGLAEFVLCKRRAGKGTGISVCSFNETLTWFSDGYVGNTDQEGELF